MHFRPLLAGPDSQNQTMYPDFRMELEISVHDLQSLMQGQPPAPDQKFCLLDVREPWEADLASIDGGRLIPMGELPARASSDLDQEAYIVVYCHHGNRSRSVVMWLREQGFHRAQSLAGGIDAWSSRIDPLVPRY